MCGGTAVSGLVCGNTPAMCAGSTSSARRVPRLRDLPVVDYSIRGTALYGYSLGYVSAQPSLLADVMRMRPAES